MINSEFVGTFVRTKFRRFQTESNGCYICWKNFSSVDELRTHLDLHLSSVIVKNCNASWKSLGYIMKFSFPAKNPISKYGVKLFFVLLEMNKHCVATLF